MRRFAGCKTGSSQSASKKRSAADHRSEGGREAGGEEGGAADASRRHDGPHHKLRSNSRRSDPDEWRSGLLRLTNSCSLRGDDAIDKAGP
jgi:hypothetical protein